MKLKSMAALAALCLSGLAHADFVAFTESINTIGDFTWTGSTKTATQAFNIIGSVQSNPYDIVVPFAPGGKVTLPALTITEVALHSTTGQVWTDTDLSNGFSFQNLAVGSYYLTVSGTSTAPGVFGAYYLSTAATPVHQPTVPEPESLVLALAGLGCIGVIARRRQLA